MHIPPPFREDRIEILHALVARHPFACLVTQRNGAFEASHLPLLLDPTAGPLGTLTGHLARANPLLADGLDDLPALVVFTGEQGYVSPSWYPAKREHGKVVPTWNYAVVHAHGRIRRFDDPARLRALVDRLTDTHESRFAERWATTDAPPDFVDRMLTGIVGLDFRIARLEGKWKLSQNRAAADRAGVVAGLAGSDDPADRALAELMAGRETT